MDFWNATEFMESVVPSRFILSREAESPATLPALVVIRSWSTDFSWMPGSFCLERLIELEMAVFCRILSSRKVVWVVLLVMSSMKRPALSRLSLTRNSDIFS